jgi:NADH-quinone oxidoreductase subunit N
MYSINNFIVALPEVIIAVMAMVIMMTGVFLGERFKNLSYGLTQITLIVLILLGGFYFNRENQYAFYGQFHIDNMTIMLKEVIYLVTFFILIYSKAYIKYTNIPRAEFYVLTLLSVLGAMVLVSANNLVTIYIGLELHSLPIYALIAIRRKNYLGAEASFKYFILGAIMSAFLLYGMSFIYGVTGSLDINVISSYLTAHGSYQEVVLLAMVFFIVVGAFKLGAAPFHQWVPDVYVGSPNMATAYLATVPKIAAYGMLFTLLVKGLSVFSVQWSHILIVLAVISIFIGNVVALVQKNIKRMFAYSTVSHVGFVFLALAMTDNAGYAAAMYYIIIYVVMTVGAFGVILLLSQKGNDLQNITDLSGLSSRHPWLAFMMMIILFSMAGIPPFAGFTSKFLIVNSIVAHGYYALAVYILIMSVVASFYYLKVIKVMYFDSNENNLPLVIPKDSLYAITINCLFVLLFGVFPIYLTTAINIIF